MRRRGRVPHVSRLWGPGCALCCSGAQLRKLPGSAYWHDDDGTETGLQDGCVPDACAVDRSVNPAGNEWPSYNRTLTSERYSPLAEINANTVGQLKVLCTYEPNNTQALRQARSWSTGPGIGTTRTDIFSIDAATCAENWRTREDFSPSYNTAMRGAAYFDGMLFRGYPDGQVLAYDFKTGKQIWQTTIADVSKGEYVTAAPITWNGLVHQFHETDLL